MMRGEKRKKRKKKKKKEKKKTAEREGEREREMAAKKQRAYLQRRGLLLFLLALLRATSVLLFVLLVCTAILHALEWFTSF